MAELVELGQDESWDLVGQQPVCRIAWTSGTGPVLLPVNHVVHGRSIWIRTAAWSSLVREVDDMRVAALIDDVDTATRLGWSVQLRGVASVHWHLEEVPEEVRSLHTWASGSRPLWIELTPDEVYGRRLVSGD
jgi:hypothetical protein